MLYYYSLLRCHISNQMHIRNRNNLDKSWKDLLDRRRMLRVLENNYLRSLKYNLFLDK